MQDGLQDVNALVEQAAAKNKAAEAATPEQVAAREKEAADKLKESETPEQIAAREKEAADKLKTDPAELQKKIDELQKSRDELQKALDEKNDKGNKTPEQIKKDEEVYQAKLKTYAIENDLIKSEDLRRYENVVVSQDEELVFEKFSAEIKDEILEELGDGATEDEIISAIKKEFDKEFPIESKNEKVRARAEAKLKKEANEIRSPLESSFNTAKARFDDEQMVRNEYPKYQAEVKKVSTIPDTFSFFKEVNGEDEIDITVPVSEDDKKAILDSVEKIVKDPESFLLHKNGKTEDVQNRIKNEIEYQLWKRLGDTGKKLMAEKLIELGNSRGLAKGSDAGATNSFAVNQSGDKKETSKSGVTAQQDVIESTRVKK